MLHFARYSFFLLSSVLYIAGSEPRYNVPCTEIFDNKEHTYPMQFDKSYLLKLSYAIHAIKNIRLPELRDHLRCKGQAVITDKEIGDCEVSFIVRDLTTGVESLVEYKNNQLPQDIIRQLDANTHELKARVHRVDGGGDGVYYPTRVFQTYSSKDIPN